MKRPPDRRSLLTTAGAAMLATTAGTGFAQSPEIRGEVSFRGGLAIPKGQLGVSLEDLSTRNVARRKIAETRVESSGGAKVIGFSLSRPPGTTAARLQIVARLEREDGWLVARGSARFDAGKQVFITLSETMY